MYIIARRVQGKYLHYLHRKFMHTVSIRMYLCVRINMHVICIFCVYIVQNVFGHDLELGPFRNVMELLSNMKDVCVMEKPNVNSGDWLVRSREQPLENTTTEGYIYSFHYIYLLICRFNRYSGTRQQTSWQLKRTHYQVDARSSRWHSNKWTSLFV